jgi:hypothetical protein
MLSKSHLPSDSNGQLLHGMISDSTEKSRLNVLEEASFGSHLGVIALSVFVGLLISFLGRCIEIQMAWSTELLSNVSLKKLSMVSALFISYYLTSNNQRLLFKRDIFMKMCGLLLDLIIISSLTIATPDLTSLHPTHYILCSLFVIVCLLWHLICFYFLANQFFPNYWFSRAVILSAASLGHSNMALLCCRMLDPYLLSPVPVAFAYKLMLIFIPGASVKNTILIQLVERFEGPFIALIVSILVTLSWYLIFRDSLKNLFVPDDDDDTRNRKKLDKFASSHPISQESLVTHYKSHQNKPPQESIFTHDVHGMELEAENDLETSDSMKPFERNASNTNTSSSYPTIDSAVETAVGRVRNNSALASLIMSSESSSIITHQQMSQLLSLLPITQRSKSFMLRYSMRRDGASLATLLSHCVIRDSKGCYSPTSMVVIIEDSWGYIFGGYSPHSFEIRSGYYGSGESAVFSLLPHVNFYPWTKENNFFIISNMEQLAFGGGDEGFSWSLDDELDTGVSNRSATFRNKQLSSSEFFKCLNVEVWSLEENFST